MLKYYNLVLVTALIVTSFFACKKCDDQVDYRTEMRSFVSTISTKAKTQNPSFSIITQNGQELAIDASGALYSDYLSKIDGQAREDIYYGYDKDNVATPVDITSAWELSLDQMKSAGKSILCIDYCSTPSFMSHVYTKNENKGYVSFSAPDRELASIPVYPIHNENASDINTLRDAKNFLYLINGANYASKSEFITAVKNTNYDVIVMDLFQNEEAFTAAEIDQLKVKLNGGKRLVICYMSIGEAENYRYYWQKKWKIQRPAWLGAQNPDWPGNYKVCYWNSDWQNIICNASDSYLQKIIDAHFDGTYLDIIDAFEYYENKN
ncbi:MAG: endo alpha-1,4 polygalactosaminidase [Bacteroidota bacterium]